MKRGVLIYAYANNTFRLSGPRPGDDCEIPGTVGRERFRNDTEARTEQATLFPS
jgi:hypothetical protein